MSSLTPYQIRDPEDLPMEKDYIVGDTKNGFKVVFNGRLKPYPFKTESCAKLYLLNLQSGKIKED